MASDHNDPARIEMLAWLGNLVTEYNRLEYFGHQLVMQISGGTEQVWVLTADLSAVALIQALKALSHDYVSPTVRPHILHFAKGFDIIRAYRNYYIHGLWEISAAGGVAHGVIIATGTRTGRLASDIETTAVDVLRSLVIQTNAIQEYGRQLAIALAEPPDISPEQRQPSSLPEKPPLPKALERNRIAHRFFSNPLGSSQD